MNTHRRAYDHRLDGRREVLGQRRHDRAVERLGGEVPEGLVRHFDELRVTRTPRSHIRVDDRARSGDDHARRRVVGLDVVHEVLALNSTPHASLVKTTS